ncbi:hypothetical protein VQH23_26455 (plasmid) [Pararoseomonas sp. SCSIO 73927]|uniref:hypothetical protein n=1 Tax=Pararoseomonas sp. SCSIO 73927 TaxID=3114537 RepID=UPI0030D46049
MITAVFLEVDGSIKDVTATPAGQRLADLGSRLLALGDARADVLAALEEAADDLLPGLLVDRIDPHGGGVVIHAEAPHEEAARGAAWLQTNR